MRTKPQEWEARTQIESPVVFTAFEEVDGKMMASVRILAAGMSKNRRTYPPQVVQEAVDKKLFNGIRMFVNHDRKRPNPTERSLSEMVSAIESTSFDPQANAMDGRVEFFDRNFYDYAQRAKDYMGVSINALVKGTRRVQGGQVYEDVSGWQQPRSVDWVTHPAAGGGIIAFEDEDEETMLDWTKVTPEELKKNNAAVFEAIQAEAKAEAEKEFNKENPAEDPEKKNKPAEGVIVSQEQVAEIVATSVAKVLEDREKSEKERVAKRKTLSEQIKAAFEKSGLPTKTRARVMAGFEDVEEFDEAAVAEAIKEAKDELTAAGAGPIIADMGPSGGSGEGGGNQKVFSAHESLMGAFGVTREKGKKEDPKEGTK